MVINNPFLPMVDILNTTKILQPTQSKKVAKKIIFRKSRALMSRKDEKRKVA